MTDSAGYNFANQTGGIGQDQYMANIKNWLQANPTATDAEVRIQMDKYGISPTDVATALGQDPATIQAKYDALTFNPNAIYTPGAPLYSVQEIASRDALSAQYRADPAYQQAEAQRLQDAARARVVASGGDQASADAAAQSALMATPYYAQQRQQGLANFSASVDARNAQREADRAANPGAAPWWKDPAQVAARGMPTGPLSFMQGRNRNQGPTGAPAIQPTPPAAQPAGPLTQIAPPQQGPQFNFQQKYAVGGQVSGMPAYDPNFGKYDPANPNHVAMPQPQQQTPFHRANAFQPNAQGYLPRGEQQWLQHQQRENWQRPQTPVGQPDYRAGTNTPYVPSTGLAYQPGGRPGDLVGLSQQPYSGPNLDAAKPPVDVQLGSQSPDPLKYWNPAAAAQPQVYDNRNLTMPVYTNPQNMTMPDVPQSYIDQGAQQGFPSPVASGANNAQWMNSLRQSSLQQDVQQGFPSPVPFNYSNPGAAVQAVRLSEQNVTTPYAGAPTFSGPGGPTSGSGTATGPFNGAGPVGTAVQLPQFKCGGLTRAIRGY